MSLPKLEKIPVPMPKLPPLTEFITESDVQTWTRAAIQASIPEFQTGINDIIQNICSAVPHGMDGILKTWKTDKNKSMWKFVHKGILAALKEQESILNGVTLAMMKTMDRETHIMQRTIALQGIYFTLK